jgi:signal transduction histidine kinase
MKQVKHLFAPVYKFLSSALDSQMIEWMRLALAAAALLIIFVDPSEPDRFVTLTYTLLVLYTVYSGALVLLALRKSRLFPFIQAWSHWLDMGWYTVLIALSSGTNSLFFFGFFFSILTASFGRGYRSGMATTVASAIIFSTIGLAAAPGGPDFQLNRFLLRPTYLLLFGYMIASWGGYEIRLRRRLTLLKDLSLLSNPRLGVDHTIGSILERLRDYYQAEACLLVLFDPSSSLYNARRATAADPEIVRRAEPLNAELAKELLAPSGETMVIYHCRGEQSDQNYDVYDIATGRRANGNEMVSRTLANLLDTSSFVSVPLHFYRQLVGRLYLTREQRFDWSEADFLLQVSKHIIPIIDYIRLVDQLASSAAEDERRRIARDLHDSIIQPYIGLQIGLAALQRKLPADSLEAREEAQKLIDLTTLGIVELRRYVATLKEGHDSEGGLVPALKRFAARFAYVTGIAVRVEATTPVHVTSRLAAEAFQMVTEGLSNVRRHTISKNATVKLACNQKLFWLSIENDNEGESALDHFIPGSITERAETLGGQVHVEQQANGLTSVSVEIPL